MKINNKKGFEFSFGWIFAIIAGAVIIFLGIYAATKLGNTSVFQLQSEAAKKLTTLLNPLDNSISTSKSGKISLGEEMRVYNDCFTDGGFGRQKFSLSTKPLSGKEWAVPGVPTTLKNKYIFSSRVLEGKEIFFLSKPFEMPFKVADAIVLVSNTERYCFINSPEEIAEELNSTTLVLNNIVRLVDSKSKCLKEEKQVCFGGSLSCDINVVPVSGDYGYSEVNEEKRYYVGGLIYASIFSDTRVYECNVKRLAMRLGKDAELYLSQSQFLASRGCDSGADSELMLIASSSSSLNSSAGLYSVYTLTSEINQNNRCNLW